MMPLQLKDKGQFLPRHLLVVVKAQADLTARHVNVCHQVLDGRVQLVLEAVTASLRVLAHFC